MSWRNSPALYLVKIRKDESKQKPRSMDPDNLEREGMGCDAGRGLPGENWQQRVQVGGS